MNNDLDPIPGYRVLNDEGTCVEFGGLEIRNPEVKPGHDESGDQMEHHRVVVIPEWLFLVLLFLLGGLLATGIRMYLHQ